MATAKYKKWLTEDGLLLLQSFARDGLTDEEMAKHMGIGTATLSRWKKNHPLISAALSRGKDVYDNEVVEAFHKRTKGYKVTVKKHFKLKKTEYDPESGKKVRETEELVAAKDEVYIPPDTTAQLHWLYNRRPDDWKARRIDTGAAPGEAEEPALMKALTEGENDI